MYSWSDEGWGHRSKFRVTTCSQRALLLLPSVLPADILPLTWTGRRLFQRRTVKYVVAGARVYAQSTHDLEWKKPIQRCSGLWNTVHCANGHTITYQCEQFKPDWLHTRYHKSLFIWIQKSLLYYKCQTGSVFNLCHVFDFYGDTKKSIIWQFSHNERVSHGPGLFSYDVKTSWSNKKGMGAWLTLKVQISDDRFDFICKNVLLIYSLAFPRWNLDKKCLVCHSNVFPMSLLIFLVAQLTLCSHNLLPKPTVYVYSSS